MTPSDLLWTGKQDGALGAMNAPLAWDVTTGTVEVVICVVSTGVQKTHPDLTRLDARSRNSDGTGTGIPSGTTAAAALGTAMAGVAAAAINGGGDLAGVAGGCTLVSYALPSNFDTLSDAAKSTEMKGALDQIATEATGASGERWVVLLHPKQFTWTAGVGSAKEALDAVVALANVVVVVPSGDDNTALQYPADRPDVITVGAVTAGGAAWSDGGPPARQSAEGAELDLVARGELIWATDLIGASGFNITASYGQLSGTGIAAAFVAGAAGLVLSVNQRLSAADVRSILCATASHPATHANDTGYGLLNINAAVAEANKSHGLATAPTPLTFGNVAFGLRAYGKIRVERQNDTLSGFTTYSESVTFTIPALTSISPNLTYIDGTTAAKVVALAFSDAPQEFVVRYTAPDAGSPESGTLTVATDDQLSSVSGLDPSSYPLSFSATPVAPPVVDVVLVIDHSGSMQEPAITSGKTKAEAAIAVATLAVDALRDTDHIGIVRFDDLAGDPDDVLEAASHTTGTFAGMRTAGAPPRTARKARLTTATADLEPRGSTSIGGGIKLGYDLIVSQTGSQTKNIVVITDGLENTPPTITTVKTTQIDVSKARLFAIGVGLSRSDSTLIDLATVMNGYVTPTGPEASDPKLACLMSQIVADATGAQLALDPSGTLGLGQQDVVDFVVSEVDYRADFTVLFDPPDAFPTALRIAFEMPDGSLISDQQLLSKMIPGAVVVQSPGHAIFKFQLPVDPAHPKRSVGKWRVHLARPGKYDQKDQQITEYGYDIAKKTHFSASAAVTQRDSINWSVIVVTATDITLGGRVVQSSTDPGTPFTVILEPLLGGMPIPADFPPVVSVTRPDGAVRPLSVSLDASGAYSGTFTDTSIAGSYRIAADANITSPGGQKVVRHRDLAGHIIPVDGWGLTGTSETPVGGGTIGVPGVGGTPSGPGGKPGGGTGGTPGGGKPGTGGGKPGGGHHDCPHCHHRCCCCEDKPIGRELIECLLRVLEGHRR